MVHKIIRFARNRTRKVALEKTIVVFCLLFSVSFTGCSTAVNSTETVMESELPISIVSSFPADQRLLLDVQPGNGYGGLNVVGLAPGSNPHTAGVEHVRIFQNGIYTDLSTALEEGQTTIEEMEAYAKLDAKLGFCSMEYISQNGLALYVYHYDDFDIASYYDVYEAPDGSQEHYQRLIISAGNAYTNLRESTVMFPKGGAHEDWGVEFTVVEAASDHLTIDIKQSGGQHFGILQIQPGFQLYRDNGGTFYDSYHDYNGRFLTEEASMIANEDVTRVEIIYPTGYSNLPNGNYRIRLCFKDIFDPETLHSFTRDYTDQQYFDILFTLV